MGLSKAPPLWLIGMTCAALVVIAFLPFTFWGYVGMTLLGLFVLVVIRGSFQPIWDEYKTMGAFVTLETIWFAGMFWAPLHWEWFHFLFGFLFLIGIVAKFRQIDRINKGLGPDLRKDIGDMNKTDNQDSNP